MNRYVAGYELIPVKNEVLKDDSAIPSLTLHIFRFNPEEPDTKPVFRSYKVPKDEGITLFTSLNEIREQQDSSLQFDFVCRAGICGSCAMLVNGKPRLACRTLLNTLPDEVTLAPLPGFELIGDLSVNTGKWMRGLSEKLEAWIHRNETAFNLAAIEEPMEPDLAEAIYEQDRCIECGCCIAACGTAQMNEHFIGAVGLNHIARCHIDPRDKRCDADYFSLIGDENGVFGCMSLLGCEDYCPKNLNLAQQISYMRRKMVLSLT